MTTTPASPPTGAASRAARAHASLLPFALCLLGANGVVHVIIVLGDNRLTVLTTLPLVAVAIGYAVYLLTVGRPLGQVRYGRLVAHALTYAAVNTGYLLHAYVLIMMGSPAIQGEGHLALEPTWFGATFGMAGFWGLGLIAHALGALADRGFEGPRP
ncbi:hypothetical protein [Brachybacterium vulturis]|uniref:hypothetical protein n=1 Tax=Brachybacterium vulturis TaxID=2017484 RepID=UPI003735B527